MKFSLLSLISSSGSVALDDLTGLLEAETKKALHELKNDGLIIEKDDKILLSELAKDSHDIESEHKLREQFLEYLKQHTSK